MISRPTVLILGAGASKAYGFPLGVELRNRICTLAERPQWPVLAELGFSADATQAFASSLSRSGYSSVDWFLEDYAEFAEIGKACIAAALIPCEEDRNLWPPVIPDASWYEFLLNTLDSGERPFRENRLSVVTFNYDRSLEHYLFTALGHRRRLESDALTDFDSVEIVHVHGSLGEYPARGSGRPYSPELSAAAVSDAITRIIVVGEASGDTPEFDRARQLLEEAARVVFLGFGYHPASVARLGIFAEPWGDEQRAAKEVLGTYEGIPPRRLVELERAVLMGAFRRTGSADVFNYLTRYISFGDSAAS